MTLVPHLLITRWAKFDMNFCRGLIALPYGKKTTWPMNYIESQRKLWGAKISRDVKDAHASPGSLASGIRKGSLIWNHWALCPSSPSLTLG